MAIRCFYNIPGSQKWFSERCGIRSRWLLGLNQDWFIIDERVTPPWWDQNPATETFPLVPSLRSLQVTQDGNVLIIILSLGKILKRGKQSDLNYLNLMDSRRWSRTRRVTYPSNNRSGPRDDRPKPRPSSVRYYEMSRSLMMHSGRKPSDVYPSCLFEQRKVTNAISLRLNQSSEY